MQQYVVLLRGINVGGNSLIKMAALKDCMERAGFETVSTYIASGNLFVSSKERDVSKLTAAIEAVIAKTFGFDIKVVVLPLKQLAAIVKQAPKGFGDDATIRYNVIFLMPPLNAKEVLPQVAVRAGVDEAAAGPGVLYFSNTKKDATKSALSKIVGTPLYKSLTIRNWNTTITLLSRATTPL